MSHISFNGKFFDAEDPIFCPTNRSYRYGDGLFETIRVRKGALLFADLHFERLFSSCVILKIPVPTFFTKNNLENEIASLCKKNNFLENTRVRLSVCRGNGSLYESDNKFQYLLECWPLSNASALNENGLAIDIFPDGLKSVDYFSNLKSANFLGYAMAAIWAKENNLHEALVLNTHKRICDATTANIFWIKDKVIFTPPLSEGCVSGVMRKFLLCRIAFAGYCIAEKESGIDNLENADEIFLTNAIYGIKGVKQFREIKYSSEITMDIFNKLIKPLF